MVRILHVLGGLNLGGAESRIMDLYRHMDRDRVQFDFLVHMDASGFTKALLKEETLAKHRTPQYFDDEIVAMGGHIYALPRYRGVNDPMYRHMVRKFFEEHHDFNVVQGHMTSTASIYLPYARRYKSDKEPFMVTVAHTRNAGTDGGLKGLAKAVLRKRLPKSADYLFACSHLAGDSTFNGAPYIYIPNTIDVERFRFDPAGRTLIREMYDISPDKVLIGNVARFAEQKNQKFLIQAFAAMKNADRAKLILCGEGSLRKDCEELSAQLGVAGDVIFAGSQSEIQAYYSAMDIFAFPSVYEGLPGAVVEAQTSGLKCLISNTVTTDVFVTDRIMPLPIDRVEDWSRVLDKWVSEMSGDQAAPDTMTSGREAYVSKMRDAGFDVSAQAQMMQEFYLNPLNSSLTGSSL